MRVFPYFGALKGMTPQMTATPETALTPQRKSWLDRVLSVFANVHAGEGATVVLMLINIFLLLVCYSVIKTVREPLILLGGGAEVRSYAAAGQAVLLMAFVPLYGWFASRVDRARLLVGVTIFFIACIELFAAAVVARVPYTGVAFFIWVGIFNISLVAQFWSFASDIYSKEAGDRLFPIIMIGMTAGAPLGSYIAGHLFRSGLGPQVILQVSAVLLAISIALYLRINSREERKQAEPQPALAATDGFQLVLANPYLRLIAALVVLLNIVNTTGEYLVARLLSEHVSQVALADAAFNKQAYIGAFSGDYQLWVNVSALLLQAFVTSRIVKHAGLRGALLALPLVALGGYAIVAAGVSFSVVRWVKTAENATDYSIMNTARQLVWLPTTREEKYKAKQAIDTFFVRTGDVVSAGAVFFGTTMLHLTINQFALGNIALTMVWIGLALMIITPRVTMARFVFRPLAPAVVVLLVLIFLGLGSKVAAQDSREAVPLQGNRAVWSRFDNTARTSHQIEAPSNLPPGTGVFISVEVSAAGAAVSLLGRAR
jgi:AAA family ATP:ADP antiporter